MSPMVRVCLSFLASYGAGAVGFFFVDSQVAGWYGGLAKPMLTPPPMVFGIVWFVLYALMAYALTIIWNIDPQTPSSEAWVRFYFLQLLLNAAWTMFFFGFHSLILSFIDILVLVFIVSGLVINAWEMNCRQAAYYMLPYFLWILFAAYLTLGIWILN